MKKIISILLALAIALTCMNVTIFAATDRELQVPQIRVTTAEGNGIGLQKNDGYVDAQITITDTDGTKLQDTVSFKVRGNTTAMTFVEKKSYTFKFAKKKNVLGMGEGKKWALLANAFDPTLLRNYMAFDFANELGLEYTSNQRFVELWVDDVYRGCYALYEPVQEGKDRVNIDIESNGGKKDFLLEYEASRVEEDTTYLVVDGLRFIASEPDEPNEEQLTYIIDTMSGIINTLKTGTREEIETVIDVPSFAKFYLLNEYLKTMDFDSSSVFFYYKDGMLYAGPPWDYDMSTGNANYDLASLRTKKTSVTDGIIQNKNNLYRNLCDKTWFIDEVKHVYEEHYDYIENISADGGLLDSLSAEYAELFSRNYANGVWRVSKWWYNYQKMPLATYEENLTFLKDWCAERNAWLADYYELFTYEYLLGDANGNGTITVTDTTYIQRIIAKLQEDDGKAVIRAGFTGAELTITDATIIQRYLANIKVSFALGEYRKIKLR